MKLIDNYPNAERAITIIDSIMITNKEYNQLVKISQYIRKQLENILNSNLSDNSYIKTYIEQVIENLEDKQKYTKTQKELIIGNIFLPDDIKIVEILNKNEYTLEHLKTIIRYRAILQKIILNSLPIDKEIKEQFDIYKKHINQLIELFKTELGVNDQTIILNRICDLIVRHPYYFETKNTKKR